MFRHFLPSIIGLLALGAALALWLLQEARADVTEIYPEAPVQRCMNLSGALEAPVEGTWGYAVRKEDLYRIKTAGFDSVRLPVRWQLVETRRGLRISPAQLARVTQIVNQAIDADLTIILNAHHFIELNNDPDTHEPKLEAIWRELSAHFIGAPEQLIFEFINEPNGNMTLRRTDLLNRRLLEQVRRLHPDRWVIYGTGQWGTLDGMLRSRPPYDPKAMIGFHYYTPHRFTHQGAFFEAPVPPTGVSWGSDTDLAAIRKDFAKAARFRNKKNMPLLLGEFGVYGEVPLHLRAGWTHTVRANAEAAGFGWCHWGFSTTFKSYDLSTEGWIAPMLNALIPETAPLP